MADAILTQTPVRGASAVAERPDGTRLNFVPFPTPLFDSRGQFIGAVNMLIDVTASKRAAVLREQARRCRRLAVSVDDEQTASTLSGLAADYEEEAWKLSSSSASRQRTKTAAPSSLKSHLEETNKAGRAASEGVREVGKAPAERSIRRSTA
jgi:hypothetical protein